MAALTADRKTTCKLSLGFIAVPIADNVKIYDGSRVMIKTDGYLYPSSDAANSRGDIGIAREFYDNTVTGHTAGAKKINVEFGVFEQAIASTNQATAVGVPCYASDDQTVKLAGATNFVETGLIVNLNSATSVDVLIIPFLGQAIAQV
ncbi:MAG: hypothetical protein ACOZAL_00580 [Patescibacteria group bacterium]